MATATKKSCAAGRLPPGAREVCAPASMKFPSMEFVIFEDNGGEYHWTIMAADGVTLVRSGGFASYEDAERAAQHVRDGAASARFEHRGNETIPVDLIARRDAKSDEADAERWLGEGGSCSSEAAAKWQAPKWQAPR